MVVLEAALRATNENQQSARAPMSRVGRDSSAPTHEAAVFVGELSIL
jgi:hypothetical protein